MIPEATYAIYKAACDRADEWWRALGPLTYPDAAPAFVTDCTAAIRAEVAHFEATRNRPRCISLHAASNGAVGGTLSDGMGNEYGTYTLTKLWTDRHGSLRCQLLADLTGIGWYRGQWCPAHSTVNLRRIGP